jgi:hypothetical protein
MAKIYRDHVTEAVLDFGCIGERYVDVFYDWHEPSPSNDSFMAPENGGVVIKDVRVFLDGNEISVFHWLPEIEISHLADQVSEQWS